MARPNTDIASHKGRVAALSRDRAPDDPVFLGAKRDLAFATLAKRIRDITRGAPAFTPEQRDHLVALIERNCA